MRSLLLILTLAATAPVWGQTPEMPETPAPAPLVETPAPPAMPADTPAGQVLTLNEAIRRALEANLTLQRTRTEVNAADLQRRALLATVFPKVNLQGSTTQNSEEVSFGDGDDSRVILPGNDWAYRLTVTQPIYAGNRERRALQQAKLATESARQGVVLTEEQILTGVIADYLGILEGEALLTVEQRNLELAGSRQKQAQDLFDAGETTRVEVLRATSDIKAAERRIASARQLRDTAESRLRLDLGVDGPVAPIQVADPVSLFPALPPEQAIYTEAERLRPEIAQAQTAIEIARLEVLKQKGALLPVVQAEGGWIKQRSTFPSDEYGFFTVRLNVPIYQGGEVKAKTAFAQERLRQAEMSLEQTRQTVREQVRMALLDLQAEEANLRLAREQLTAAEAEYQQASELYQAQEITALESEAAETSLAEARRAVATGELDRDVAELRVWSAAGLLKETLLPEIAQ